VDGAHSTGGIKDLKHYAPFWRYHITKKGCVQYRNGNGHRQVQHPVTYGFKASTHCACSHCVADKVLKCGEEFKVEIRKKEAALAGAAGGSEVTPKKACERPPVPVFPKGL